MKLINSSRNTVLAEDLEVAETLAQRSKGLLGRDTPAALFFKTRWGIHTFGMKFPIDCVVCDDSWQIKAIRENTKPNRIFFWPPQYRNVLELPVGTLKNTQTKVGDKIQLVE